MAAPTKPEEQSTAATNPADTNISAPSTGASSSWGWNSLNTFVSNTKSASESFFDTAISSLAKKPNNASTATPSAQSTPSTTVLPSTSPAPPKPTTPIFTKLLPSSLQSNNDELINSITSELEEWKNKYQQLKTEHSLKTAMLANKLQTYKDEQHDDMQRQIGKQTQSKMDELQRQIMQYQHNQNQCMRLFDDNLRQYLQHTDDLQHEIDTKYKIFYEKMSNIALKAGLDPKQIFEVNADDRVDETMSVVSDFEEKEQIRNAEPHDDDIQTTLKPHHPDKEAKERKQEEVDDDDDEEDVEIDTSNIIITTNLQKDRLYERRIEELQQRLREYQHIHKTLIANDQQKIQDLEHELKECKSSLDEYKEKYAQTVQANSNLEKKCVDLEEFNNGANDVCHELSEKISKLTTDLLHEQQQYAELETLFQSMSDQNTEFQQQIKDIKTENELLRAQLNQSKTQNQGELDVLNEEREKLKQSLQELQIDQEQLNRKLSEQYEIGDQLREQIKKETKTSNKRHKANTKLKKKLESLEKERKDLKYHHEEQEKKIARLEEKCKQYEADETKYGNAISQHKALQHEIAEYIEENTEFKSRIHDLESELSVMQKHCDELRKQSKRDTKTISRLTNCNEELLNIIQQCEEMLAESAHKYVPVAILNAQELELTDSEEDGDNGYQQPLISDMDIEQHKAQQQKNKGTIYFDDDSDSEDEKQNRRKQSNAVSDEEDEILQVAREKDLKSLQIAAGLKIQISMLCEQLEKFHESMSSFKHELQRKEEESMRQQHQLRQIAMRQQLQQKVKKELSKRERNMVSIPSVRGVALRHKTSLANLTKTQDEVNKIVNNIESNDESWKHNISMQLRGSSKSNSMRVSSNASTPVFADTNPFSPTNVSQSPLHNTSDHPNANSSRHHRGFLSENDLLETQSQRSYSSVTSTSRRSQSAMSLHGDTRAHRHKQQRKQKVGRAHESQKDEDIQDNAATKTTSSLTKWFNL